VIQPKRNGERFTSAQLHDTPGDGHRYELFGGTLCISPPPTIFHQIAVVKLLLALGPEVPSGLVLLPAPVRVELTDDTVLQPDVLVARREQFRAVDLPATPLLAIEVTSTNSRRLDFEVKPPVLRGVGCPSYWVLDPVVPSLVAWELEDGEYVEVAHVVGDEVFHATRPFKVELRPADLTQ
jgi:Uma2 family endonuclease